MVSDYHITLNQNFKNCDVTTHDYGSEQLHVIRSTGPVGRRERIPVFEEILKSNSSGNFFYILDNRGGHEIELTPADMTFLNEMLINGGIRYVRGAVITNDHAYSILVSMANAKAKAHNFDVELMSTTDYETAETFVLSRLRELLKS